MTAPKKNMNRATISRKLPRKVVELLLYANMIAQKMTGNPHFPTPTPTLVVLVAAILALNTAETTAGMRTKGTATDRNDKRTVLVALLQQLSGYVQAVADATPENGAAIIESSGFAVRKIGSRGRRTFVAKQGAVSGSVIVTAEKAGSRAAYWWEYSLDGGKTWVEAPSTIQGKTMIAGLPAGTTVMFRYRAVTPKDGQGDWAQPVALLVK